MESHRKAQNQRVFRTLQVKKLPRSLASDTLGRLIDQAKLLNIIRNHVAHGMLALAGAPNDAPRGASFKMLRYNKGKLQEIDYYKLMEEAKKAMKLSSDYSEFLAKCNLSEDFTAPIPV